MSRPRLESKRGLFSFHAKATTEYGVKGRWWWDDGAKKKKRERERGGLGHGERFSATFGFTGSFTTSATVLLFQVMSCSAVTRVNCKEATFWKPLVTGGEKADSQGLS